AGRAFTPDEYKDAASLMAGLSEGSLPSAIVTRKMAERLWPGEDPIGKGFYSGDEQPTRVVGVVEHLVRPSQLGGPSAREYSMILPLRPHYNIGGNYVIRTDPDRRQEVLEAARKVLQANGADRIILEDQTKTFEELRSDYYQGPRSMAWLLGIVCVALLLITALGIIGLASFWVQQRTKQIGIRRALGATRGQVLRYFQTENFLLASIGIALGMLLAFAINQVLMGKYELARLPLYYLPAGAVLLWVLGQLAVYAPARRAAPIPPATATRTVSTRPRASGRHPPNARTSGRHAPPARPSGTRSPRRRSPWCGWPACSRPPRPAPPPTALALPASPTPGTTAGRIAATRRPRAGSLCGTQTGSVPNTCPPSWSSTTTRPSPPRWKCCSRCTTSPPCMPLARRKGWPCSSASRWTW